MRINIKALPKERLFHLFDLASKAENRVTEGRWCRDVRTTTISKRFN